MSIIGINGHSAHTPEKRGSHDSGACLIKHGKVVAAANEERFSRVKQDSAFPFKSLAYINTLEPDDKIRSVALCWLSTWQQKNILDGVFKHLYKESKDHRALRRFYWKQLHGRWARLLVPRKRTLPESLTTAKKNIHEHHHAHAASAYYCCPWPNQPVLTLTLDGQGDFSSASVWIGKKGKLTLIDRYDTLNSLGHLYGAFTSYLGFSPNRHEGKIVGLAAYGKPTVLQQRLLAHIRVNNWHELFDADVILLISRPHYHDSQAFIKRLCKGLSKEDIAAGIQSTVEYLVCHWVSYHCRQHQISRLALAGGVFANVKLNQRIMELAEVENIYVHPNMGDGGLAVGAALASYAQEHGRLKPALLETCYLGPNISEQEASDAFNAENLNFSKPENLAQDAATLLASGNVVARAAGQMEYGPRALGNRSLLASCNDVSINQWLNDRLHRTEFMPFAPIIMEEYARDYFPNWEPSHVAARFMTVTYNASDLAKKNIPAAVHVDGTARPQILRRHDNPEVHQILTEYYKLTGIPALINTSFNMHEEPIVCSAKDAVRAFRLGHIDSLICGPFLCVVNLISSQDS